MEDTINYLLHVENKKYNLIETVAATDVAGICVRARYGIPSVTVRVTVTVSESD